MSKNVRTRAFRDLFDSLDPQIQRAATKAFELFKNSPRHVSLNFHYLVDVHLKPKHHPVNRYRLFGVKVTRSYRAVAVYDSVEDANIWFFIGNHDEYLARFGRGSTLTLPLS